MLDLVKTCAPWLNWKTAGLIALVAVGAVFCLGTPALGLLAGAAPILLIIACLSPCLIPLALLRRGGRNQAAHTQATIPLTEQPGQAVASCGCGRDSCDDNARHRVETCPARCRALEAQRAARPKDGARSA